MTRGAKTSSSQPEQKVKTTPIAVIGIGSLFPQAHSTQQYWDNILRKIDCITDVPASRWSIEDYYDPNPTTPDKSYCKRGGFIPDVDFDPMEFGLPPNILEVTDVSQLLSLVIARDALEDAGYGENREFDRERTGCVLGFVGTSSKLFTPLMTRLQYPVWEKVLRSAGLSDADTQIIIEKIKTGYVGWEENSFPGAIGNVVSGRICNRFDLGGLNCVVDAACASSLAAIKMAVGELIEGRAYMMITGGVDTDNSINSYMCFSKTPAFTKKENVRPFDAESGGMMVGEGLGMIVLKRLEDAERDGDRIYAVIKAIGTSSDGRFKSIYAPRPAGQARAMRRAYEEAGFAPETVGLIEAHGTGTMAGDPSEFQGINEVFSENNPRKQHIALGSVKSQIAHTKAAAGAASMIKTSLALYHKVLPPTINVNRPNEKLGIENSPFYLNTEARPWIRSKSAAPRRAGVSSFGFGGTNYHVVLEEYTAEHQQPYRLNSVAQPVLLSAADPAQLLAACKDAQQKLQGETAAFNFANLIQASRAVEIPSAAARVGFVAEDAQEASQLLQVCIDNLSSKPQEERWEHPKGVFYRKSGMETQGKVVALFSGQGSQYLDMGRELALNFPTVREVFAEVDELFVQDQLEPLSSHVYPRPVFDTQAREALSETLTRTEHAQPAIGAMSVALYKLLQQAGFSPDFTAGHSFGELTALWAAGVINEMDYYALAKARGKAMAPPNDANFDAGTMVAVKGDAEKIRAALQNDPEVTLANWNSNDQVVIAGSKPAMTRAQQVLNAQGFKTIPLPVSAAFHTPLVGHAQKPFAKAIQSAKFHRPKVRVYSNSTAQPHAEDPKEIQTRLAEHILNPVLFRDEIENIYAAGGTIFVEFGPKNVLTNLVDNILAGKPHLAVALNANAKKDSDRQLRDAVMALRVAGLALVNFDPFAAERKATLPRKKSPVTVKLNGGYYVSEKTRASFQKALNDGFKVSLPAAALAAVHQAPAAPTAPAQSAAPKPTPLNTNITEENASMSSISSPNVEHLLADYQAQQTETVRLHEQYLRMEEEYARAFAQMTSLQSDLVARLSAAPGEIQAVLPLFESLERSMTRFHEHQAETLRIHQRYLETQQGYAQSFVASVGAAPVPLKPASMQVIPVPAAAAPARTNGNGAGNGAGNGNGNGNGAKHYTVPAAAPAAAASAPAPAPAAAVPVQSPAAVPAPTRAPAAPAAVGLNAGQLKDALLQIVSEKTGYPVETLELDMDMEADLGIDSIKRVEILGAMTAQFPDLPAVDNTALAEMRTLGQIVDQFSAGAQAAPAPAVTAAPAAPAVSAPAASASVSLDAAAITKALLEIVSEKTGYPVETLELDMDMEADLGIDSIKRVEILGAMQAQFPELPAIDNAVLAELRTLGQITQAMGSTQSEVAPVAAAPALEQAVVSQPPAAGSAVSSEALSTALLEIVSEKTGYPVETLEMDMDMEADLGIDSIKRVEILGALQAQFPDLPQADAAALSELRTLGQIIDYMSQADPAGALPAEVAAQSPFEPAESLEAVYDPGIEQGIVIRKTLPAPDFMEFDLPQGHVCLIMDDGSTAAPALAQALREKNWPVVVLRLPESVLPERLPLPQGVDHVTLVDLSEAALQESLQQIASRFGPTAVFVHLSPARMGEGGLRFPDAEKALLKVVFLIAKHLKSELNAAAEHGRAAFLTVTRLDGAFGLEGEGDFTAVYGGLFGLVKTLNLEWEAVFCRALDISPALETDQAVSRVLAELHDPNRLIAEVGYTAVARSTLALESVPVTGGWR